MKLTPLDIRKQEFTRAFRGYEVAEVQAFLQTVAEQWQQLLEEHRRQADRIRELEEKLKHYQRIEEALQQALETARENARQMIEQTERKARLILEEAQARAEEIRWETEQERRQLQQRIAELVERRDELIARLRAFLRAEMEVLAKFEARVREAPLPKEEESVGADETVLVQPDENAESAPSGTPETETATAAPETPSRTEAQSEPEAEAPPLVPRFATFQRPESSESSEILDDTAGSSEPPEPPAERKGWTVRSIVGTPSASPTPGEAPQKTGKAQVNEEFEKIRRILKDLD